MFSDLYFNTRNQPIYNTFTDWRGGHLDSNWLSFHHPSHSKWEGGGGIIAIKLQIWLDPYTLYRYQVGKVFRQVSTGSESAGTGTGQET